MKLKKILAVVLSTMMVAGMATTGMAGSDSDTKEFTPTSNARAYFDAYCGYSSGSASTSVYGDANTTWATVDVSMDMYIIDADSYEDLELSEMEEHAEYFDSSSGSSSDYDNAMAIIDVDTTGTNMGCGVVKYHGFKVKSNHEAVTNLNNSNPVEGKLEAYY